MSFSIVLTYIYYEIYVYTMPTLPTKQLNELVEKKVKKNGSSTTGTSLKSILSDFDVMPFLIGFVIATPFNKLLTVVVQTISRHFLKTQYILLEAVMEFILTIGIVYLFVYELYYKYLVDEDISKERIVKTAINEAKVEAAKKEIKNDPETKKSIEDNVEFETFDTMQLFARA